MGETKALRDILGELAARAGWDVPRCTERVGAVWERIAPPGLAAHCWVSSMVRGVLELASDAPVWAQEVRMVAPELVVRLNQELGEPMVREITVVLRRRRARR